MKASERTLATVPHTFLDVPIPDTVRADWFRWEAARWRQMRHRGTNNMFPPDQRFDVRPPAGLCAVHLKLWTDYRDLRFDPYSGNRWPGHPGSPFIVIGSNLQQVREWRRCEWDDKASQQMQLLEKMCLSGRSPQCPRPDGSAPAAALGPAVTA